MAVLAAINYDPGTAVLTASTATKVMTAIDTTHLRNTFTAPANGAVLVRMRVACTGAANCPKIFLGVLDGATVKMRMAPMGAYGAQIAALQLANEVNGVVSGLTPGNSYTWDAAWGIELGQASSNMVYGGPNDASGADAYGGFVFEVWETTNLLGSILYDPSSAATLATTSLLAMTAMDTTNLRITFTAPASGKVMWRIHVQHHGSTTFGSHLLGIMESTNVRARVAPVLGNISGGTSTANQAMEASGIITGLTPSNSYTYDAAYAVQTVAGAGGIKYGGPDNTTQNDAFGAAAFEIWTA